MKNSFWLCVAFVVCFGIGFLCGMFAQSRIIDGCDVSEQEMIILVNADATDEHVIKCLDGTTPDKNGCCTGELYTDMGDLGYNCCPDDGGDCFPPIVARD